MFQNYLKLAWRNFASNKFLNILGLATGIAATVIGFQAIKAAIANPVKSLRTE